MMLQMWNTFISVGNVHRNADTEFRSPISRLAARSAYVCMFPGLAGGEKVGLAERLEDCGGYRSWWLPSPIVKTCSGLAL